MPSRSALPFALAPILVIAACSPQSGDQQVIGNAIATEEQIDGDAVDRAEHLDQLSAELAADANGARGAERDALRNRSTAALDEAAEARTEGDAEGAAAADRIEAKAGLLNAQ
ncbi:MAG: hypothetical protein KF730_07575 [Sphingomonas sp.]|uniref:hypothetical protein n=1 Tax=Sphingomonas sp. TaxID=28214 RepID=UPI0025FB57E6|nr:hypothetical protein [Sphingomonas sp.]MBX3564422.1 hypothetical protein [Sphingomonas sp.]